MSATLGPIHYRMYGRILLQDQFVLHILRLAEKENWQIQLPKDLPVPLPVDDIAKLVNHDHIHGWLSDKVEQVEMRMAIVLSAVLAEDKEARLTQLANVFSDVGHQYKIQLKAPEYTAKTIYELVHYYLLDGMPCDFPFKELEEGSDFLYRWQVASCPHAKYYEHSEILSAYYQLRVHFVRGLLVDVPVVYTWNGTNEFSIQKEKRG